MENETIEFEGCYKNSILKKDVRGKVSFRIPSIDDLIRLKKIRKTQVLKLSYSSNFHLWHKFAKTPTPMLYEVHILCYHREDTK
jgi:hypothetical protein